MSRLFLSLEGADDFGHGLDIVGIQPLFHFPGNLEEATGIDEDGGAHSHGGGAGHHELQGVQPIEDPSHPDDGDLGDGLVGLIDLQQGDGLEGRAREAPGEIGQPASPGFQVDGETGDGVDEGEHVGAGIHRGPGEVGDMGHVGGELGDEGEGGGPADGGDHLCRLPGVGAEGNPPRLHIGA